MRIIVTYTNGQTYTARSPAGKNWAFISKYGSPVFKYWVEGDRKIPAVKVNLAEVKKIEVFETNSSIPTIAHIKNNRIYSIENHLKSTDDIVV